MVGEQASIKEYGVLLNSYKSCSFLIRKLAMNPLWGVPFDATSLLVVFTLSIRRLETMVVESGSGQESRDGR